MARAPSHVLGSPPQPFIAPVTGDLDLKLAQIASAINGKADRESIPVFAAVVLISPDGHKWEVQVSNSGVLSTTLVPLRGP